MKEILERWKAESPQFFKELKVLALKIGGIGTIILGASLIPGINLDEIFIKIISYLVVACAAIAGTSQLTKN